MTTVLRYYPRAVSGDGGMTGAVAQYAAATTRLGVRNVIAYHGGPDARPCIDTAGVEWVPVDTERRYGLELPVGIERVLAGSDLLVLHSAWTAYNVVAGRASRRLGIPYVLEPRGAYDPHIVRRRRAAKLAWWHAAERRLVAGARAVHVFFEQEAPHLAALGYRGPLVVARNGVRTPAGHRWAGGAGPLVWLGRFDPVHKGLDLLLDAVRSLPSGERPQVRLHGPDWHGRKADVGGMVRSRGLQEWVQLAAPVYGDEKWRVLSEARGFVYPSRWEAFGNSPAEAASLGVPMAVTPYPLGQHLARAGGAVLSPATPTALGPALATLWSEDTTSVGRRAAEVARDELAWDVVARAWWQQAQELL